MQLEDWTRLISRLTGLTLRINRDTHHRTLADVLPRLTTLQSLVLTSRWLRAAGGLHIGCRMNLTWPELKTAQKLAMPAAAQASDGFERTAFD